MLFPTIDFAIFFAVVFVGHWLLQPTPTYWKWFMIAASYFFYAWWDWRFMGLLAASMVINQAGALWVHRSTTPGGRRTAVVTAVVANLLLLGWFKYYGFLSVTVDNVVHGLSGHVPLPLLQITLPVGISFFTFMGISYVIDVYRDQIEPAPWLDFAVYLSFFPHLVAGPIVRGSELLPQVRTRRDPRQIDVGRAAYLIFAGLFKKMVISSYIASAIVDPVFGAPGAHTSLEILFAIYGYAVQIYADFSGYTDIAICVALLLGFKFPQNFDAPYAARSLQDFWRRWHITLSRWLRDYLYIPLGGSRRGQGRTYVNILVTMLLGGLWHGAGWTFVAWGGLHGVGQALGHNRRRRRLAAGLSPLPDEVGRRILQRFLTFNYVCLGWVFFRSDSFHTAALMLWRLLTAWGSARLVSPLVLLTIAFGVGIQYVPKRVPDVAQVAFSRLAPVLQGALLAMALYAITTLAPQGVAPFIYFQF